MHKLTKQIFKGPVTHVMSILISFFSFYFKTTVFVFVFLTFFTFESFFTFWYTIQYLGNINGKFYYFQGGKTVFTTVFLTVANTL